MEARHHFPSPRARWVALALVVAVAIGLALALGPGGVLDARHAQAATGPAVKLKKIATVTKPISVAAAPGDTARLFIVQKNGYVRIRQNGTVRSRPFLDIHRLVSTGSEQGLLSMAFDPDYATNGRFYVDYTNTGGDTRVVRYRVKAGSPNVADPASRKVLLKVHQPFANHNGGQLQFGPDGKLYVGLGDGGSEGDPNLVGQSLKTRLAKILRLNLAVSPIKVRTYAYGLRNPWRFSFDSKTGNLWIGDVGQNNWEEIDFLKAGTTAGTNFGWSYYEGDHVYKTQPIDRSRLKFPATEYSHSLGSAVIGGYVYRGSAIPALQGDYLFADLSSGRVWFMTGPSAGKTILSGISQKLTSITSFGQDASGELYLTTLGGGVYKIVKG